MKKLVLSLSFVCYLFTLSAQTQGPNSPSASTEAAAACLACPGSDWLNYANVYANDNVNVTNQMNSFPNCFQSSCYYTKDLEVSSFGFSIPALATIDGIMVEIKKSNTSGAATSPVRDSVVRLMTSVGTLVGLNKALTTQWSSASIYYTYGGATDLWGSTWLPSDINSTGFGVAFKARNTSPNAQIANVDHIRITIYYTNTSIGINEMQSQSSGIVVFPNPSSSTVTVISSDESIESITVFDILGNKIMKNQYLAGVSNHELDMKDVAKGIYFVQVKTKNGTTIKKFIRE